MFFILIYHILSHYFPLVNKNPFGFSERVKNNFCVLLTDIKLRTLYTTLHIKIFIILKQSLDS